MIVVIDYGMGNNGSIINMLKRAGAEAEISSDPAVIGSASKLVLPGVGSFDNGMKNLEERGLLSVLRKSVLQDKTPILGICLGMQLFTKSSEEGRLPGLGWLDAHTVRFRFDTQASNLKIPHPRFYFVHSYHLVCNDQALVLSTTHHGYAFASVVAKGNIVGTQFHPEKSHKFGLQMLKNWVYASC